MLANIYHWMDGVRIGINCDHIAVMVDKDKTLRIIAYKFVKGEEKAFGHTFHYSDFISHESQDIDKLTQFIENCRLTFNE